MTSRYRHVGAAFLLLLGLSGGAVAQNGGRVVTPLAPGPDIPTTGIGAIGPGNVPVAPGRMAPAGEATEQISPGGTILAPGAAESTPLLSTPATPAPRRR